MKPTPYQEAHAVINAMDKGQEVLDELEKAKIEYKKKEKEKIRLLMKERLR